MCRMLLIVLFASGALTVVGCVEEVPSGSIEPLSDHFYLPPNAPFRRPEFTVLNPGDAAVKIIRVESSCGCAVPELSEVTVEPGQHVSFPVDMSRPLDGVDSATISLITDSQATPTVTLNIAMAAEGKVAAAITGFSHQSLDFEYGGAEAGVFGNDTREFVVTTIEPSGSGDFVLGLNCTNANVSVNREPSIRTVPVRRSSFVQREYAFELSIRDTATPGTTMGYVSCLSRAAPDDKKAASVPVHVRVAGPISALPEMLFAGTDHSVAALPSWYVTLSGSAVKRDRDAIDILASADWLSVTVVESDAAEFAHDMMKILVEVIKLPDDGADQAGLNIRYEDKTILHVPIYLSAD